MTTTILIIIRLCFSRGDTIILSSVSFIQNVWPYGLVLVKYIYVIYRFQFGFVLNINFRSKYCSHCNNHNSKYLGNR